MSEKEQLLERDYVQNDGLEEFPLLNHKRYDAPSVFTPENLLREARRQKGLPQG